MSIHSQPHESTGISPYEMMFGVLMRLPMELKDGDIPQSASKDNMAHIMPHHPEGNAAVEIFESVDKIWQIIHNSASGNISRAKTKQVILLQTEAQRSSPSNRRQSVALQQKTRTTTR